MLNKGLRLPAVGGWSRLAVGGDWRLVAIGGSRVVGGGRPGGCFEASGQRDYWWLEQRLSGRCWKNGWRPAVEKQVKRH